MEGGPVQRWLPQGIHQRAAMAARRDRACADEGGDAQPPHRHLALPGRGHRCRRRDPRRRRHRPRRAAQGRADRLHGVEPAPAGHGEPWERAGRQARPHRQRAADHDRRPAGRRRVQQRIRPAQPGGYFRVFEQAVAGVAPRLPQAHHDRRRPGQIERGQTHKLPFRPGTLLVQLGGPGMRIGMGGGAASSMAAGTNTAALDFDRCSAATPRSSAARRRSSTTAGRWAKRQPGAGHPRRGRRRHQQRLPRTGGRRRPRAPASTCAPCRWKNPAWRPRKSGATRARSATCWPSPRPAAAVPADVRARALPVCRGRRGHRGERATGAGRRPRRRARHRHADGRAAGQAAARCTATCSAWRAASRRWT
jgi:hypothetical protein